MYYRRIKEQKGNMNINKIKVGDIVELLQDEIPYYSGYAGNPHVTIPKGSKGIVGATKVPYVRGNTEKGCGDYFVCVDFILPNIFSGNPIHGNNVWRCGVNPKNIKTIKE